MRNRFSLIFVAAMLAALNAPAFAAGNPAALLVPFSDSSSSIAAISDGYFEPVKLDGKALFASPANSKHDLVLPHLGKLAVVHDRTRIVDLGGSVTRWEGHVQGRKDLSVTFVRGISGMVSGVIDTPAGRVLLGQAGDYIVYKQSQALPAAARDVAEVIPEALLEDIFAI